LPAEPSLALDIYEHPIFGVCAAFRHPPSPTLSGRLRAHGFAHHRGVGIATLAPGLTLFQQLQQAQALVNALEELNIPYGCSITLDYYQQPLTREEAAYLGNTIDFVVPADLMPRSEPEAVPWVAADDPRPPLADFARGLADFLPGKWTAEHRRIEQRIMQRALADDLWTGGSLRWATFELAQEQIAVLTGPYGMRLLAVEHPFEAEHFIVGAASPLGFENTPLSSQEIPSASLAVFREPQGAARQILEGFLAAYYVAVRARVEESQQARGRPVRTLVGDEHGLPYDFRTTSGAAEWGPPQPLGRFEDIVQPLLEQHWSRSSTTENGTEQVRHTSPCGRVVVVRGEPRDLYPWAVLALEHPGGRPLWFASFDVFTPEEIVSSFVAAIAQSTAPPSPEGMLTAPVAGAVNPADGHAQLRRRGWRDASKPADPQWGHQGFTSRIGPGLELSSSASGDLITGRKALPGEPEDWHLTYYDGMYRAPWVAMFTPRTPTHLVLAAADPAAQLYAPTVSHSVSQVTRSAAATRPASLPSPQQESTSTPSAPRTPAPSTTRRR